jgi:hypothetical protein
MIIGITRWRGNANLFEGATSFDIGNLITVCEPSV